MLFYPFFGNIFLAYIKILQKSLLGQRIIALYFVEKVAYE